MIFKFRGLHLRDFFSNSLDFPRRPINEWFFKSEILNPVIFSGKRFKLSQQKNLTDFSPEFSNNMNLCEVSSLLT